jgi:formylglycine-generating enzyme required for sulfatase activity
MSTHISSTALVFAAIGLGVSLPAADLRVPIHCEAVAPIQADPWNGTDLALAIRHRPTGIALRLVPAASYTRGSPAGEAGREPDETPQRTTLSRPFYLGVHEVTMEEWEKVMGEPAAAWIGRHGGRLPQAATGSALPMTWVSWEDATAFCRKLGPGFRLPTEAEWELACRAGTTGPFAGDPATMAWTPERSGDRPMDAIRLLQQAQTQDPENGYERIYISGLLAAGCRPRPVGTLAANPWGFHDLHGNVWEWCHDWYGPYPVGAVTDPTGPTTGKRRVNRGGSWAEIQLAARSAQRMADPPEARGMNLGFRIALDTPR